MNTTLSKILAAIGLVLVLGALGMIIYNQQQIKTQQMAIQVTQQQLADGIVRSQANYATKDDINAMANANGLNLKAIQDNLDKLNSQITSLNIATIDSTGQNTGNLPSSGTGPANPKPPVPVVVNCPNGGTTTCPNQDLFGYQAKEQTLALNEDFANLKVPIGTVGFSAWQQNPWNIDILPREYNIDTVVGVDQNERQTFYNKVTVKEGAQTYTLPIKTATTEQVYPSPTFSWWNPRLLMGLNGGINATHLKGEFSPNLNLGIMSYGQYKTTPDWSVLELGVGYETVSNKVQFSVTPVAYNIGKNLLSPLANNTYMGPALTVGVDGSIGIDLALRVGF